MFLECGRIVAFASAIEHMARNFEGLFLRPRRRFSYRGSIAPSFFRNTRGVSPRGHDRRRERT